MRLPGRTRRDERSRLEKLAAGEAVDLACRLRRTSARGWSPWIAGTLKLPGASATSATFVGDVASQVSLVSGHAGRTGPIDLGGPVRLTRRPVRFKGEAFFGVPSDMIVLSGASAVTELAIAPAEVDAVVDRLLRQS